MTPTAAAVALSNPSGTLSVRPEARVRIVLFSGGSGTGSIASALLRNPQLALTVVINAYDDGHSTGRLRRFIPGMLGPSDVRKNINRMMPASQDRHAALRFLSDHRLPRKYPFEDGMKLTQALAEDRQDQVPGLMREKFDQLSVKQAKSFQGYFRSFLEYARDEAAHGNCFDFDDCALGNILFAGCYLQEGRNFNDTTEAFSKFFEIQGRILNVTRGENLFLMARTEEGTVIRGEAELVSRENSSRIHDLFLIDERVYRDTIELDRTLSESALDGLIASGRRIPEINSEAKEAIETADVIVYGPGTQHSSLLPSYLTRGVAEAIAANKNADKVFISNIRRDVDIQHEDASELAAKFLTAMNRNGEIAIEWNQAITHFFLQKAEGDNEPASTYVPFNEALFQFPMTAVTARDWESQEGKHAGGYVIQELSRLVQCRIGATLQSSPDMVSIVVPALNEEATVAETLRRLTAMDFGPFELGREIIFVDGESTDRTFEIASNVAGVRAYRLKDCKGRGAALRFGVEKSRGDIVVFFPADLEYLESDLYNVVFSILRNGFKAVFGTRAVKCTDLSSRLKNVYGNKRLPYLVSKYGGILLSTTTLFLYNRYVTDTLTSIKGFDAKFLRSLDLKSNGMDLDAEIVAKTGRRGEYILEVPVEYQARTKAAGKKSTTMQGLKTLWALVSWRFAKFV
jgi:2-phospho-L-lactate transferase/gluconeogenesis factor (CofD/UPF0052 family)